MPLDELGTKIAEELLSSQLRIAELWRRILDDQARIIALEATLQTIIDKTAYPCPCCEKQWECLPDCTFEIDDPDGYDTMKFQRETLIPARDLLKPKEVT